MHGPQLDGVPALDRRPDGRGEPLVRLLPAEP
jgi:hypothetical protein